MAYSKAMQTSASLRLSEVCTRLGITENQVRLLADRGDLPSYRSFGGQRRFRHADVEAFAAKVRADNGLSPGGGRGEAVPPGDSSGPDGEP